MMTATYSTHYAEACNRMDFVVKSLAEKPGRALQLAINSGGQDAVQALFDAVMDRGYRQVLVTVLDCPALPQWVRDRLQTFLYGNSKPLASLLMKQLH